MKKQFSLLCVLYAAQWVLWGLWQNILLSRFSLGPAAALWDAAVIKCLIWAFPFALLLRREKAGVSALFSPPFPWLACTVLLCLTTVFLYTVRLASGLVNTHVLFDPVFLVFSLTAGVYEEFCFRGGFFRLQAPTLGFWPAALFNGVLFTLYHYPDLLFGAGWTKLFSPRALLIFVMGVVFCWMFQKWRNLALNMVVHTVWDVLSYLFCLMG